MGAAIQAHCTLTTVSSIHMHICISHPFCQIFSVTLASFSVLGVVGVVLLVGEALLVPADAG